MTKIAKEKITRAKLERNNRYMPLVTNLKSHASLLIFMYRDILRSLARIRKYTPVIATKSADASITNELDKATMNPQLYGTFLKSELRYYVDEEFRAKYRHFNSKSLFMKLLTGNILVNCLKDVRVEPLNPHHWSKLIKILVHHRKTQHLKQSWKLDKLKHKDDIDQGRSREVDSLTLKRIQSRSNKPGYEVYPDFSELSSGQKYKEFRKELSESKKNSQYAVRKYLKHLQLNGLIPNPYKLPYVSDTLTRHSLNLPKALVLLPGSTKSFVVNEAYDMEYIDAILKPELEFIINKNHLLKPLEKSVLEDGPYKVKIRNTTAGVMTANFIRAPNYRPHLMKELALDIKKLMRCVRKQFIWNLDTDVKGNASEKAHGDGYGVRGSLGHSPEEIMYPRKHHEKLADQESFWEALMSVEYIKADHGEDVVLSQNVQRQLKITDQSNYESWREPLEEATQLINSEIQAFYDKYKITRNSPIWNDQETLQEKMDMIHERRVDNYSNLVQGLEENNFFLHSDLFMIEQSVGDYEATLTRDSSKRKDKTRGLSEFERSGLGKRFPDYLEDTGNPAFRMGNRFTKRFKF